MYVCICHGIRDKDVRSAVCEGEISLHGVYKKLGCKPRCGSCLPAMADAVASHAAERADPHSE